MDGGYRHRRGDEGKEEGGDEGVKIGKQTTCSHTVIFLFLVLQIT